ncbi:MAG: hypothetical protein IJ275_07090 [Ruminococcus sp.]|nr:hypothetical protein [Ruminococcus sp.]
MKRRFFKTIAIFIVIAVFSIILSLKVDGYDMYTYSSFKSLYNVELLQNNEQVFLVGTNGSDVQLDAIYPDSYSVSFTLENNVYAYNLFSDTFLFISPVETLNQTQIVLYDIYKDTITSFYISGTSNYESSQIAYSNGCIYIANDYGEVRQYSKSGKHIHTYKVANDRCHLMCDYNGAVYCFSNNSLFELYNQSLNTICRCNIDAPASFISDNAFIDNTGYIYTFSNNRIANLISFPSTVIYPSGGIHDNCVITSDYDTVYAVDINTNRIVKHIKLNRQIRSLCVVNDNIFAFIYHNGYPTVCHVEYSKLKSLNSVDSAIDKYPDISDEIYSDTYTVDHSKLWITDIEPETTVAQFKRNMNYDGYDISFERFDGKIIDSGKIGTATIVTFYNEDISIEYELSVKGDLTGEGNMNSRDKKMMFKYLLEEVIPSGVYVNAADLDYSNSIDIVDLVLLTIEVEDIQL